MSLSRLGRKQQLGMGLGTSRARQGGDPQHPKSAQSSPGGTQLLAQAPVPTGSQQLGPGGLSWALRTVQSEAPAVQNSDGSDPAHLQTPAPSYLLPPPPPAPSKGATPRDSASPGDSASLAV